MPSTACAPLVLPTLVPNQMITSKHIHILPLFSFPAIAFVIAVAVVAIAIVVDVVSSRNRSGIRSLDHRPLALIGNWSVVA